MEKNSRRVCVTFLARGPGLYIRQTYLNTIIHRTDVRVDGVHTLCCRSFREYMLAVLSFAHRNSMAFGFHPPVSAVEAVIFAHLRREDVLAEQSISHFSHPLPRTQHVFFAWEQEGVRHYAPPFRLPCSAHLPPRRLLPAPSRFHHGRQPRDSRQNTARPHRSASAPAMAGPTSALRPYQAAVVDRAVELYGEGTRRLLVPLATGLGKTVVFTHLPQASSLHTEYMHSRCLWLVSISPVARSVP